MADDHPPRPIAELQSSGLLWLINKSVFHPRGVALALHKNDAGDVVGWSLLGDGTEPWTMGTDIDEGALFEAVNLTFYDASNPVCREHEMRSSSCRYLHDDEQDQRTPGWADLTGPPEGWPDPAAVWLWDFDTPGARP